MNLCLFKFLSICLRMNLNIFLRSDYVWFCVFLVIYTLREFMNLCLSKSFWVYVWTMNIEYVWFCVFCIMFGLEKLCLFECCNLSFGFSTNAKGLQGCGPRESPRVTSHTLGSVGKCEGVNLHTPKATPTFGDGALVDSWNFRERFRGQNSMACGVLYIIGKLLEHKCLKWACIAHLDIWNTSYGQKKGRKSNWQFDSRPLKVGNRPNFRVCRWHVTYHWKKLLMRATTLL